jgi:AcrR family transcriptional regulator
MGLREIKKEQTRRLIVDTAWRLFSDRGFDRVTVVEVAHEAQVAEATVFNYFPTKEDLFFFRLEAFGSQLIDAISGRDVGEPVLVAFRRYLLESGGLLAQAETGDPGVVAQLRTVNRVIAESPALLAREQRSIASQTEALAALLRAETAASSPEATASNPEAAAPSAEVSSGSAEAIVPGAEVGTPLDDVGAQVAANALMGVHRALIDHVRRRVLADDEVSGLATDVHRIGTQAFALLERGLHDYAAKPGPPATGATPWPTPIKEPAS